MAIASTTLSAAVAIGDQKITVASATSIAAGRLLRVDGEFMRVTRAYVAAETSVPVTRGVEGTAAVAHPATALVVHGDPADWGNPGAGTVVQYPPSGPAVKVLSYSAAGAIALPAAGVYTRVVLNGGDALAMTIADPGQELNGTQIAITADDDVAHTITNTTGFGGAGGSYDVLTLNTAGTAGVVLEAQNGVWIIQGQVSGTITNVAWAIA